MLHITVRHDLAKASAMLRKLAKEQVPFALAKTLTDLAKEVQREVRVEMPKNFTLRRQWIVNGIRIKAATKRKLESVVYSRDKFMARQESGGIKRAPETKVWRVGDKIAIPTTLAKGGSRTGIVPKRNWPENLIKPFRIRTKDGHEYLAVRRAHAVQVMYVLQDQVKMKDRLKLHQIGQRVVAQRFNKVFGANLGRAIASAN